MAWLMKRRLGTVICRVMRCHIDAAALVDEIRTELGRSSMLTNPPLRGDRSNHTETGHISQK